MKGCAHLLLLGILLFTTCYCATEPGRREYAEEREKSIRRTNEVVDFIRSLNKTSRLKGGTYDGVAYRQRIMVQTVDKIQLNGNSHYVIHDGTGDAPFVAPANSSAGISTAQLFTRDGGANAFCEVYHGPEAGGFRKAYKVLILSIWIDGYIQHYGSLGGISSTTRDAGWHWPENFAFVAKSDEFLELAWNSGELRNAFRWPKFWHDIRRFKTSRDEQIHIKWFFGR